MTINTKEVKLQEFQFKVNNHILVTKSFLLKIKKVDNDRSSYCNQESETIIHDKKKFKLNGPLYIKY